MLVGGQAKLDKNNNNRIDAEDFKILKASKVKKAKYGAEIKPKGPGVLRPKPTGQGGKPLKPKPIKPNKKMGGGMIGGSQMPGYKTGTSVKARGCKLGRSKPTKMY